MRYAKSLLMIIVVAFVFAAGCSGKMEYEVEKIEVLKRIGDEPEYEFYKEVTDEGEIQTVRKLLGQVDWENAKVQMARPGDYRFEFPFDNQKELFELWVSPKKDKVELVIHTESKYVQLGKKESAELFGILTGKKLSDSLF